MRTVVGRSWLIAGGAAIAIVLAGCSGSSSAGGSTSGEAVSPSGASASPTGSLVTESSPEPSAAASAEASSGASASAEYAPVVRPATKKWKIGYGDGLAGIPFTDSVTKSMNDVAAKMGIELVYCDDHVDQEKTVACANSFVSQHVDGVVFANWVGGTEAAISKIYSDAGIPCVTYSGPHPGCPNFGANEHDTAFGAGQLLAQQAIDRGWDPAETWFIAPINADVPVELTRRDGATAGVLKDFAIPSDHVDTTIPSKGPDDIFANVTAWATAHPDAKNVLCFGTSDAQGVNCGLALEKAGYTAANAASVGEGASDEALVELRKRTDDESIFKGTMAFFPETWGQYLLPAIVDILEGKQVPAEIYNKTEAITRANLNDYYPAP
jgi:ribose transport system substrate-binding protein